MGLRDYKSYKKREEILSFFKEFGITEEILKDLPRIYTFYLNNKDLVSNAPTISEDTKKEIQEHTNKRMSIEDYVELFAGETEEFYPNGKPSTVDN